MRLLKGVLTLHLEEHGGTKRNRGPKREFTRFATRWGNGIRRTRGQSSGIFSIPGSTKEKASAFFHCRIGRSSTYGSISKRKIFPSFRSISPKNAKRCCEAARLS